MEVQNGLFNTGELEYIVEVLLAMILAHLQRHMSRASWLVSELRLS